MANYEQAFATQIPAGNVKQAAELAEQIETLCERAEDSEEFYDGLPEYISNSAPDEDGNVTLYMGGYEGFNSDIADLIQAHYDEYDLPHKVVISGSYGCSKLRPDEFGGWAVAISKDEVYWVDAVRMAHEHLNR